MGGLLDELVPIPTCPKQRCRKTVRNVGRRTADLVVMTLLLLDPENGVQMDLYHSAYTVNRLAT